MQILLKESDGKVQFTKQSAKIVNLSGVESGRVEIFRVTKGMHEQIDSFLIPDSELPFNVEIAEAYRLDLMFFGEGVLMIEYENKGE